MIIQIQGEPKLADFSGTFYNLLFVVESVATCSVEKLDRAKKCGKGW